jgi:hypothetical protein
MKTLAMAVAALMVTITPALAGTKCPAGSDSLITGLNKLHKQLPDMKAHTLRDPVQVAKMAKIVNEVPLASNFPADEIVVVVGAAEHKAGVILVYHGCIMAGVPMPAFIMQMQRDAAGNT